LDPAIFWVRGQRNVGGIWEILQFALEQVDKAGKNQVKQCQISNQTPVEITEKHDQILETFNEGGAGGGYQVRTYSASIERLHSLVDVILPPRYR
jgi:hypothetical protein